MTLPTWVRSPVFWLVLLVVTVAAVLRLNSVRFDYYHPDEVIAVEVARSLLARGSFDTNWALVSALPDQFRQAQYNFSAYLLAAAAALALQNWIPGAAGIADLQWLRGLSAALGTAVAAATFWAGRRMFGTRVGLGAAAAVAVNPLLYQDSLYARPETWVTLLTLAVVGWLGSARAPSPWQARLGAFLLGLLVATKLSMLLLVPLLLVALQASQPASASWRDQLAAAWTSGRWLLLALALGFACGAPGAIAHAADYLEGVAFLRSQYTTGHWPHGLYDQDMQHRLAHAGRYFRSTTGAIWLLAVVGGTIAAWRREVRPFCVFMLAVATALQFSIYATFFERNLSHIVPVFAIFAVYALAALMQRIPARREVQIALLAVALAWLLAPSVATSKAIRLVALPQETLARLAVARTALTEPDALLVGGFWTMDAAHVKRQYDAWCGPVLVSLPISGSVSDRVLRDLIDNEGFRERMRIASPFPRVPTSTLHTYFAPAHVLLTRPADPHRCSARGHGRVSPRMAGTAFSLVHQHLDAGWRSGGAYGGVGVPYDNGPSLGSWAGSDTNMGVARVVVDLDGEREVVMAYVSGPDPRRQSVRLFDADTGVTVLELRGLIAPAWRYQMLRMPAGIRRLGIEATDAGTGWGEWQAFALPRRLAGRSPPPRP